MTPFTSLRDGSLAASQGLARAACPAVCHMAAVTDAEVARQRAALIVQLDRLRGGLQLLADEVHALAGSAPARDTSGTPAPCRAEDFALAAR